MISVSPARKYKSQRWECVSGSFKNIIWAIAYKAGSWEFIVYYFHCCCFKVILTVLKKPPHYRLNVMIVVKLLGIFIISFKMISTRQSQTITTRPQSHWNQFQAGLPGLMTNLTFCINKPAAFCHSLENYWSGLICITAFEKEDICLTSPWRLCCWPLLLL